MAPGSPPREQEPERVRQTQRPCRRHPVLPRRGRSPLSLFVWTIVFIALIFFNKSRAPPGPEEPAAATVSRTVIVLDESGSMHLDRQKVIKAMNDFITAQQSEATDCRVTFLKFNDQVKIMLDDVPMKELRQLTDSDYQPNGGTALFDAIGAAIGKFHKEKDVLLVIMTDGDENSSEKFDQAEINKLVEQYTSSEFRWNVEYLAAEPRLQMQGENLGIKNNPAAGVTNGVYEFADLSWKLSQRNSAFHKRAQKN